MIEQSRFFEYVANVLKSSSVDQVWGLLLDATRAQGFDRLLYVSTRFLTEHSADIKEDALILTNHHQDMVDVFVGEEIYKHTPTIAWDRNAPKVISWRKIQDRFAETDLSEAERRMQDLSRRLGVLAGYTVTLENSDLRSRAVLGLCARAGMDQDAVDEIWMSHGEEILAIANLAHLKMASLPQTGQCRPLTTRQRDALLRVSDGETMQDIAAAMGLTVSAVEKILRQARVALGVRSTVQAVKRATLLNLLSPARPAKGGRSKYL